MAFASDSTTAPARPLLPFAFRPATPVDDPRSPDELLEEIRRTIEGQKGLGRDETLQFHDQALKLELPVEPLLPAPASLPALTSAFSRRRAIFGAVALAAAPTTTMPAAAHHKPSMRPKAAALWSEFNCLFADYRRAGAEFDASYDAVQYPEAPEDLFFRPGDTTRLNFRAPIRSWMNDRHWYGDHEKIEDLRAAPFRFFNGNLDTEGAARRDEIVDAWDRWRAATRHAEDIAGYTAASDRFDAANQAYTAFWMRLVDLRTSDSDIMALKALVARDLLQGDGNLLDRRIEAMLREDSGPWGSALSLSLTRDFIGLLGAAHV